ncbi:MAG: transglutaminase domain-containing protein [Armatimonadota bacterium]
MTLLSRNRLRRLWLAAAFSIALLGTIAAADSDFTDVDRRALAAPRSAERSVSALAAYLSDCGRSDRDTARAIFTWTAYNVVYDTSLVGAKAEASSVLRQRRAVCAGYAVLFKALAEAAGLEAVVIYGEARGRGPAAARSRDGMYNHDWNAVKLDGEWRLVDCAWGAGHLDERGRFIQQFEDHYFLTPPEQFARDHFPNDSKWQLLDHPLSRRGFLRQADVRPAFFEYGLRLASHAEKYIEASSRLSVTIGAPREVNLMASLHRNGVELQEGYTFAQRKDDGYEIQTVFPKRGDYLLRVHARRAGSEDQSYDCAVEYRVHAGGAEASVFPKIFLSFQEGNCSLDRPLTGPLRAGKPVAFRLTAPGADDVLVLCNGSAKRLGAEGGGVFEATLTLDAGDAIVFARYPGQTSHLALLQYKVRR